jgi:hypothetical protein
MPLIGIIKPHLCNNRPHIIDSYGYFQPFIVINIFTGS